MISAVFQSLYRKPIQYIASFLLFFPFFLAAQTYDYPTDFGKNICNVKIEIQDPVNNSNPRCDNFYRMYYNIYNHSSEFHILLQQIDLNPIKNQYKVYTHQLELEPSYKLGFLHFYNARSWRYWTGCDGLSGEKYVNTSNYIRGGTGEAYDCMSPFYGNVYFTIKPHHLYLYYFDPSGNQQTSYNRIISPAEKITLKATQGYFPEMYNWKYRIRSREGLSLPQSFPENIQQSGNSITFSGSDLPISFEDCMLNGKTIEVFIDYDIGTSEEDDVNKGLIILYPKLVSPEIIRIEPIPIICPGQTGGFTVYFSRKLIYRETLDVVYGQNSNVMRVQSLDANAQSVQITGLEPGNYTFTLSGTYLTESYKTVVDRPKHKDSKTLSNPPQMIQYYSVAPIPVQCYGEAGGGVTFTITGGEGQYRYSFDGIKYMPENSWNKVSQSYTVRGLKAGNYQLYIKDKNGCTPRKDNNQNERTYAFTVPEPAAPINIKAEVVNPSHNMNTDGLLKLTVSGGNGGYTYDWYKDHTLLPQKDSFLSSLGVGEYQVIVKDRFYSQAPAQNNAGCVKSPTFTLNAPGSPQIKEVKVQQHVSCYGKMDGKIEVSIEDGKPPYDVIVRLYKTYEDRYQMIQSLYTSSNKVVLDKLVSGRFEVEVMDVNSKKALYGNVYINEPSPLQIGDYLHTPPSCFGSENASLGVSLSGGTPPYSYEWKGGTLHSTAPALSNLPPMRYNLTVKDRNLCSVSGSYTIFQPDSLQIVPYYQEPSGPDASDGSISLSVLGGTPPYTYHWKRFPGHNQNSLTHIPAGSSFDTVQVTDSRGCSKEIRVRLIYPLRVNYTVIEPIQCKGDTNGKIRALVSGGIGTNYTYIWYRNELGSYLETGNRTPELHALGAGKYALDIKDEEENLASIEFELNDPDSLTLNLEGMAPLCFQQNSGKIQSHPSGGTLPYSYSWSDGQTEALAQNLAEGTYHLLLTDAHGCTSTAQTSLVDPSELKISLFSYPPKAYNDSSGSIVVKASGGTLPYHYYWYGIPEDSDSVSSLPAGTYSLFVSDTKGCLKEDSIVLINPPLLKVNINQTALISCKGVSCGELTAESEGGVGVHQYQWYHITEDDSLALFSEKAAAGLSAGTYRVKVTDANGIERFSDPYSLPEPEELQAQASSNDLACNGDTNGWVKVRVSGGTLPYVYQWNSGHTTAHVEGLTDAIYEVDITDARGCVTHAQTEISVPAGLVIKEELVHPVCFGQNNGSIRLKVSGGMSPYTFEWENGNTQAFQEQLVAGTYQVTIKGADACFKKGTYTLAEPEKVQPELIPEITLCKAQTAELIPRLTDSVIQYQWYKGGHPIATTPAIEISEVGNYLLEVKTDKGCKGTSETSVYQSHEAITADFAVATLVVRDEPVQLVNTNFPAPDFTEWIIPEHSSVQVLQRDEEYAELLFTDIGTYVIGMHSTQGKCDLIRYKTIEVIEKKQMPEYDLKEEEPFLKQFSVSPNPAKGGFSVQVELSERADIQLRLLNELGILTDKREAKANQRYTLTYPPGSQKQGVYILQLITPKAMATIKVIILNSY